MQKTFTFADIIVNLMKSFGKPFKTNKNIFLKEKKKTIKVKI